MKSRPIIKNSVLIVAHPDDEALWFGALLPLVEIVIFVFKDYAAEPGLGQSRARVMKLLPYNVVSLGIPEAGTYGLTDWENPKMLPHGIQLRSDSKEVYKAYKQNYNEVREGLRSYLSPGKKVFTHNPWGEYGHPDHVQVSHAVKELYSEIGFGLSFSSYNCSRTEKLASRFTRLRKAGPYLLDLEYVQGIAKIYKECGCWTWENEDVWAIEEYYLDYSAQ